jgi:hypothetical protein
VSIIHSPVEGFTGDGPGGLKFEDGRAETDDQQLIAYFRKAGYGIGRKAPEPPSQPEPADPREHGADHLGTRLRDAAVDPEPDDFLPPTNAGQDNPHGSTVVAPGLHAVPPAPIHPGPVPGEPEEQAQQETALAAEVLTTGTDVREATQEAAEDNPQPEKLPARSASKATWVDWAVARGASREAAEAATKDVLIEQYGPKEEEPHADV